MRVAVYARVSTGHIEQESSYENQYNYFKNKIDKEGNELFKFYGDKGISGTSLNKRPEFNKMLYDCGIDSKNVNNQTVYVLSNRQPLFNMIYTKSTSRLARTTDIINVIGLLKKKNVAIYFDDLNKTTNDIDSELLINILILLDANFSKDLSRKIKFGMKQSERVKLINQKIIGYDLVNDKLVPNKECIIIQEIMYKYTQQQSLNSIALDINEKFNKSFDASSVRQIVNNVDKYAGYIVTNKMKVENHVRYIKDRKDWIITKDDRIEPIITEDTRKLVLYRLDNKIQMLPRNHTFYYKKVICANCGQYYNYNKAQGRLVCHNKRYKKCNSPDLKEDDLKEYLNDLLFHINEIYATNILVNKNILDSILESVNKDEIYKEIEELNAQREKLLDLYLNNLIDKSIYIQRENQISTRIKELNNNIDNDFTNKIRSLQDRLDNLNSNIPKNIEELLDIVTIYVFEKEIPNHKCKKPRLDYNLKINEDIEEIMKEFTQ